MSWYYTREAGAEGEVLTDEGTPLGTVLTSLLESGPLPIEVGLEIIAFMADILTIAEEDEAMHGNINPGDVYIDVSGAVSLAGYGVQRARGRAPEGKPQFLSTDVYGLGIVLHAILSREPMGVVPRDRDGHDDAIVDRLLAIDWSGLHNIAGRDPVVHFLCSMLAFDPDERPAALDVANILSEVARQLDGQRIEIWAQNTLGSGASLPPPPSVEEVLEAPRALGKVFNKTGHYARRQTASAKGECTAFWSREKISAMLDEGEDQLAASQMFQRQELVQRLKGQTEPPSPMGVGPTASGPKAVDYPEETPWAPDSTITGQPENPDMRVALQALREEAQQSSSSAPPPAPPPIAAQVNQPTASPAASLPPLRTPATKPFPWLAVVLTAVGVGFVFVVLSIAAVVYYYTNNPPPPEAPAPVEVQAPAEPPPVIEAEPEPEPKPKPVRKKRAKRSSSSTRTTAPRRPVRTTAPPPAPAPPPATNAPYQVTFRSMGAEAKFACGDGQSGRFVGVTRREFTDVTTCRITIDDAVGAVQLRQASMVNCTKAGTAVNCTGAR